MKSIKESLEWRYATQKFDTTKKLTDEEINELLDCARLSPSWYGLQPWKFIIVEDQETRVKLREAAYNQPKVTEASHLIVFAHKTTLDEAYVDSYIQSSASAEGVNPGDLKPLKDAIMNFVGMISGNVSVWASNQTHIAFGFLLESAALLGIDAGPMGGFNADKFDEILGLKEMGLHTAVICAVGHRLDSDPASLRKKSRFSLDEVVIRK